MTLVQRSERVEPATGISAFCVSATFANACGAEQVRYLHSNCKWYQSTDKDGVYSGLFTSADVAQACLDKWRKEAVSKKN